MGLLHSNQKKLKNKNVSQKSDVPTNNSYTFPELVAAAEAASRKPLKYDLRRYVYYVEVTPSTSSEDAEPKRLKI